MNDILLLKGQFEQKKNSSQIGASNIPKGKKVCVDHLVKLQNNLIKVLTTWDNVTLDINPLVSAYYIDVMAKSNRIKGLLSKGKKTANSCIVGAKFADNIKRKHIITYYISKEIIQESIKKISKAIYIIDHEFKNTSINHDDLELINKNKKQYDYSIIAKTSFTNIIVDAYYLEKFDIEMIEDDSNDNRIVSIYDTGKSIVELMEMLNIDDFTPVRSLDNTTILLRPDQYKKLIYRAPFLISMSVSDISELNKDMFFDLTQKKEMTIPPPTNECVVGVIDTMFSQKVYFSQWVEFKNCLDDNLRFLTDECVHGTKVTSIIVDGPSLNPDLDDGCGRFKVKHFGISNGGATSSFTIIKLIKEIVTENKEIKVWNLSLGGIFEINSNFISPEAAILDQIQFENDVIFVISGTNKTMKLNKKVQKIAAPADSINSIVVNSVDYNNTPASYSRSGGVLSFYNKPDISYYGGDKEQGIWTYSPSGECVKSCGTSYAAPWITRKLAYLINVLGLTREVAKAMIIDSATNWKNIGPNSPLIGYGVVPIKIKDIVQSKDNEIKFILNGVSEKYDTYNFNIPIPKTNNKYPFIAKATLCYFPKCSRNQGVDYTNTEMDLHFGRIDNKNKIKTINENIQDESECRMYEGDARKNYRKWDNIKHISELIKERAKPKKVYENEFWGISIKTKERINENNYKPLNFGVVITLREMNGINRIEDFIHQCAFRGWIVNRIDVQNRVDIYNKSEAILEFDD